MLLNSLLFDNFGHFFDFKLDLEAVRLGVRTGFGGGADGAAQFSGGTLRAEGTCIAELAVVEASSASHIVVETSGAEDWLGRVHLAEGTDGALFARGSSGVREETGLAELGLGAASGGVGAGRSNHALSINLEGTSGARHGRNHTGLPAFTARRAVTALGLTSEFLVSAWGALPRLVGTLKAVATGWAANAVLI
jgi:hypothetical protein